MELLAGLSTVGINVVPVHRVVESKDFTYIVIDYCEGGGLFTQILHQRQYLGQDELAKHVFLQLFDAVACRHSLGYLSPRKRSPLQRRFTSFHHRLWFGHYRRVQRRIQNRRCLLYEPRYANTAHLISDFLKRTHRLECHGGQFAHNGLYFPLFNGV